MNALISSEESEYIDLGTGKKFRAREIVKPVSRSDFTVVYLTFMMDVVEILGTKKLVVLKHLLTDFRNRENQIIGTVRQIAKACGVSTHTVYEVLQLLLSKDVVKRELTGVYRLNPLFLNNASAVGERKLITTFKAIDEDKEDKEPSYSLSDKHEHLRSSIPDWYPSGNMTVACSSSTPPAPSQGVQV